MPTQDKRTIYDVAFEAGVAISTVSRVLNGSDEVSPATRARVQAAIEKLQYRPQRTARALAQRQTHTLAVAMPSFTSLFYVEVLKGVKDELRTHDIDLLLCDLGSVSPYRKLDRFLNRGAVDALLLASVVVDEHLERELQKLHAPVVLVGMESAEFDCIFWDDFEGAEKATRHLAAQGHARIGIITADPKSYLSGVRLEGYRRALQLSGLPFDPELVVSGDTMKHSGFSEEAGYEGMSKLLELADPPTAVFVISDVKAFGACAALRDAGLSVPRDVALVGYDNIKLARYLGLTTVDQKMYEVGRRAAKRLVAHLGTEPKVRIREVIHPELVVRRSSAARR